MYVQNKLNISENQVDTLKDAIRLKKGVTLCFPKGGIRGDHVLLKHDKCYGVQKCNGDGPYLAPHPRFVEGDGMFLKHGEDISDGAGLLIGKNNPFKNIPVLGWLL